MITRKKEAIKAYPEILQNLRLAKGIKQARLARTLGISRQMMSQWEKGITTPTGGDIEHWGKELV